MQASRSLWIKMEWTALPVYLATRQSAEGWKGETGKREKNERGGGGGGREHEQRAYSRVKSHHSVTVGWSMKRNLRDLLRHFSATSTCRTASCLFARQNGDALFLGITTWPVTRDIWLFNHRNILFSKQSKQSLFSKQWTDLVRWNYKSILRLSDFSLLIIDNAIMWYLTNKIND